MTLDEGINWYGWMNGKSGYSVVNLEYATALERQTGSVSIGWERAEHIADEDFQDLTDEQQTLLKKPFTPQRIGIIKTTPQMFFHNQSTFRIGYTMVENTMIGKRWVELCNQMDAVFVPSPFLVEVFTRCGVKPPVYSVKQGVDPIKFPYHSRSLSHTPYVFGTCGYMDDRKNWKDLVTAFVSEFAPSEPVELWIKNSNPYFAGTGFKDPRIKVVNRRYTVDEVNYFYQKLDCFVFPSHAEGSGLPPREAMATGLPTIVTNWSGLSEVCNPAFNYPLTPVAIDYPDIRGDEQPGFMARLDVQEIMYWMRYVYEHREEAKYKGKLASQYIHQYFNWDECANNMLATLAAL